MRLLTPHGVSGVAVLSFTEGERNLLRSCLRGAGGKPVLQGAIHKPIRARLLLDRVQVDDVLLVDRGKCGDELHTHGAPAVLEAVQRRFGSCTTKQVNDSAEALAQRAVCVEQLALAAEQVRWSLSGELSRIERMSEPKRRAMLLGIVRRSRAALAQVAPFKLVLVGRQNVGKSTLFNKLVGRNRVVAGPQAGLTRDSVGEKVILAGYAYELLDASGDGEANSEVDAEAIDRARWIRRRVARLVVLDAARELGEAERSWVDGAAAVVLNKIDLRVAPPMLSPMQVAVSALRDEPALLRSSIGAALRRFRRVGDAGPVGGAAAIDSGQVKELLEWARRHGLDGDCCDLVGPA